MQANQSPNLAAALANLDLEKTFAAFIAMADLDVNGGDSPLFYLESILSESSHPDKCLNEAQVEMLRLLVSSRRPALVEMLHNVARDNRDVGDGETLLAKVCETFKSLANREERGKIFFSTESDRLKKLLINAFGPGTNQELMEICRS